MDENEKPTVVVVDDDKTIVELVCDTLAMNQYKALGFTDPFEVLEYAKSKAPLDALVSDYYMPIMTGFELIEKVIGVRPHLQTIIMTALADKNVAIKALNIGCHYLVEKPFTNNEFIYCVEMAVNKGRWQQITESLLVECKGLIQLFHELSQIQGLQIKHMEGMVHRAQLPAQMSPGELHDYLSNFSESMRLESRVLRASETVEVVSKQLERFRQKRPRS